VFLSPFFLPVYFIVLAFIVSSVKILREYERAVVFRLGRFQAVKGPGLILILPFVQQVVRVDLRTVVMEVPGQDVISRDNVSLKVDAILYFRVMDAQKAIIQVENFLSATNMLAQTTLRSVLGEHELDEVLAKRTEINAAVQNTLDVQTESWGIKVISVEIREVTLTENMIRSIAKQAEAERDRRAKVIHAEAEFQAAQTLLNAARILAEDPAAMQLRYLQTLTEVGGEQNSTIIFPMPIDLIKPFLHIMQNHAKDTTSVSNGAKTSLGATPPK
jgi:regulator of protease activity HflC (stomatin/prohibitin superfamily)